MDLPGRHALIGGGSRGIGLACARRLAGSGASVTLLARDPGALRGAIAELPEPAKGEHRSIPVDMGDGELLAELVVARLEDSPAQILINNSGGPPPGPVLEANASEFQAALNRHLFANQLLVQKVVNGMRRSGYGRIVNIISTSVREPIPGLGVSNTTRGAVASWAKTLATELGPDGITVNNVLPGFTRTERLEAIIDQRSETTGKSVEAIEGSMKSTVPLGRFADPDEVAAMVAFLVSPDGSYVSGQSIAVDGGRLHSI